MKKLLIILLTLSLVMLTAYSDSNQAEWTLMIFINGDNNLSGAGADDINEMEMVGSTDKVNIVVEYDSRGSNGTKRYYIEKDSDMSTINSPVVMDMEEQDTGDWQHALEFFKWGADNYPAEKYLIAFWNHGAGWEKTQGDVLTKGICYDDDSGNHMTTPQIGMLCEELKSYIGKDIDILGYDACLMQMVETAYEVKDHCLYQIGAEETEPADGWPYDDMIAPLAENPYMTPEEFGKVMVQKYGESYMGGSQGTSSTNQSLVDLSKMEWFRDKVNVFSDTLSAKAHIYKGDYENAIKNTQKFAYSQYKDLGHFCRNIIEAVDDSDIKAAAEDVLEGLSEFVVEYVNTGASVENSTGVSIYIPSKYQFDSKKDDYAEILWAQHSNWDEFLTGMFYPNYPVLKIDSVVFSDISGDGKVSPGETVEFEVRILNEGTVASGGVEISLEYTGWDASLENAYTSIFGVDSLSEEKISGLSARIDDDCAENTELTFTINVTSGDMVLSEDISVVVRRPFAVRNDVLLIATDSDKKEFKPYIAALNDSGIRFDLWDNSIEEGKVPYTIMEKYINGVVIVAAPGTTDIGAVTVDHLANYLEAGGNLFVSGQDVGYKLKSNSFYREYLHAEYVQDNTGVHFLKSEHENYPDVKITGGTGANNQKWPDEIEVLEPAQVLFRYEGERKNFDNRDRFRAVSKNGHGGLFAETSGYKVVYFAFGFEAISDREIRKSVMKEVLSMLRPSLEDRLETLAHISHRIMNSKVGNNIRMLLIERDNAEYAAFDMAIRDPEAFRQYRLDEEIFGDLITRVRDHEVNGDSDDLDDLLPLGKPNQKK
ncbi:MAG: clostripain-related cysteine peptidase [Candidatus Muiribacteriaceae bacterium]